MSESGNGNTRRTFLQQAMLYGGGLAVTDYLNFGSYGRKASAEPTRSDGFQQSVTNWSKQIGIGLYTVRDLLPDESSYRSTLEKLAAIGYKEVEPADRNDFGGRGYAGLDPKAFRALLDANGLTMPSTHTSAIEGPDLDTQLEAFQVMGIKYTEVIPASAPHAAINSGASPTPTTPPRRTGPPPPPARTLDTVKRMAARANAYGEIAKKFGIKILVRMDIDVFVPLSDNPNMKPFEVLTDNTDPNTVAMQIDFGWAAVAGEDIPAMFKRNPGRYELWHVKDLVGIHALTSGMSLSDRRRAVYFVPVGLGQLDLKAIFASADVAGLKHIGVEQDNALTWGDSMAAARVNYVNLAKVLS